MDTKDALTAIRTVTIPGEEIEVKKATPQRELRLFCFLRTCVDQSTTGGDFRHDFRVHGHIVVLQGQCTPCARLSPD